MVLIPNISPKKRNLDSNPGCNRNKTILPNIDNNNNTIIGWVNTDPGIIIGVHTTSNRKPQSKLEDNYDISANTIIGVLPSLHFC
jgi:hypothetical protein